MAVTRVTTYCCPPFERAARHASLPLRRRVYVCKPGTHQPWLASWGPGGSCCRVRSASASCNSDSFDHVAEVAGYVCPGSALLASAHRDASSLRGLRVSGAWSESCDVANAHPARAPCPPNLYPPPRPFKLSQQYALAPRWSTTIPGTSPRFDPAPCPMLCERCSSPRACPRALARALPCRLPRASPLASLCKSSASPCKSCTSVLVRASARQGSHPRPGPARVRGRVRVACASLGRNRRVWTLLL